MSIQATLYFRSGRWREHDAPRSVDPDGKFVFGRNFPRMIDTLDESARQLNVPEPSQFIWHDPMDEEGELDKLSSEQFEALRQKYNRTMFWIPLEVGIKTFSSLASLHKLNFERGKMNKPEYYLAFEVACYGDALREAVADGEQGFHIQCF